MEKTISQNGHSKTKPESVADAGNMPELHTLFTEVMPVPDARDLINNFANTWTDLERRIGATPDYSVTVDLPDAGQYMAFRIDLSEMRMILKGAAYVVCIYCINTKLAGSGDDTVSVLFMALDNHMKPLHNSIGIEKWPGVYKEHPVTGASYTNQESADLIKDNIITTGTTGYTGIRSSMYNFLLGWENILQASVSTSPITDPVVKLADHPLAYLIPAADMSTLITGNTTSMVGIFGFSNLEIVPHFAGVGKTGVPTGKFLTPNTVYYKVSEAAQLITDLLTP